MIVRSLSWRCGFGMELAVWARQLSSGGKPHAHAHFTTLGLGNHEILNLDHRTSDFGQLITISILWSGSI